VNRLDARKGRATTPATAPAPPAKRGRKAASVEEMYDRILGAIIEHRLPPGARLIEDKLAEIFRVGRARVRQVLARLAHEEIVTLQPNRGAFVAEPTVEQARQIFELRRLIEPGMVRRVVELIDDAGLKRLRAEIAAETKARADNERPAIIRLSGEFHLLLAELTGNALLTKMMRELESLTCLIIFLYDAPSMPACRGADHATITDAIAARDANRAAALILEHLNEVEKVLDLHVPAPEVIDLEQILT
jgi:DNA-binding GntR family transcriptional regulator